MMKINIQIDENIKLPFNKSIIRKAAQQVIAYETIPDSTELSIVLQKDSQLQELNFQYRGIDSPTDVLAFPADEIDPDSHTRYIGDVIISIDHAEKQAQNAGHSIAIEIQILVVHGTLHLTGYDHENASDQANMWRVQKEILSSLGINNPKLPE